MKRESQSDQDEMLRQTATKVLLFDGRCSLWQSGAWGSILQRASLSDSAGVTEGKKAAAFSLFQLVVLLLPLAFCSCREENATASIEPTSEAIKMPARGGTVSVVAVGDILLGGSSAQQLASKGYNWSFEHVQLLLGSADLVIGNLAAPVTTRTKTTSEDKTSYKVSPASAPALKRAGFHALSLGNDHILDYGLPGLRDTITALQTNNIAVFGAGENEEAARHGVVWDFGMLRIGLLSYGQHASDTKTLAKGKRGGYALLSEQNLEKDIAEMHQRADVVVVSLHWGKNYKDVTEEQEKMGHRAIELGADIVCGHHPHIAQGIEIHKGKPIIYSLGNFVFGSKGRYPDGKQGYGLVSRWIFEGKTLRWVTATPIAINNEIVKFQPKRVPAEEAREVMEPHLKRYGTEVRWEGDTAFIGFGTQWQNAALPKLPWQDHDDITSASAGAVPTGGSRRINNVEKE